MATNNEKTTEEVSVPAIPEGVVLPDPAGSLALDEAETEGKTEGGTQC